MSYYRTSSNRKNEYLQKAGLVPAFYDDKDRAYYTKDDKIKKVLDDMYIEQKLFRNR